ncbi:MAG: primase, primase protein [Candidatus Parcubacteria bacterium]|jgi:DNA primase
MSDSVEQIKNRLSIIDVISPYVELHRAGKNFKGKSPFTAEKTPSFYVSPDRGMYYCFSTSQGGDMFTFVQAMEGVDFKEALKILADKAGVELVAEDPKKKTERERWYAALQDATQYYVSQLEKTPAALEYLENRGVTKATLLKWQIGFAPGPPAHGWRMVKDALESKGYTRDELFKVGLIKSAEGGKEPFDVFRDRIMFPLFDQNGKVVAFSGRILSKDSDAPKYVNSPETELYKKSELLFGYDKAKHGIRHLNFSLIVEGQFDVVMAHQAGYANTVAVSGTALTLNHVHLLERLSDRVVLALDADRAGIAAMKRAADLMLRRGIDVKVAEMPLGKDPADIIRADAAEFKQIVGKSVHVIEFLLHVLTREESDERNLKRRARAEILPFLLLLPDRIDQEHFIGVVANAIHSTTDAVRFELDKLREETKQGPLPHGELIDAALKEAVEKPDIVRSARVFLEAAVEVVEGKFADFVKTEISGLLTEEAETEVIPESELAGVTFTLEQQFAKMPELAVQEEIISRLNIFRTALIRRAIALQKQILKEAEEIGDDTELLASLESIKKHEAKLKLPAYTVDAAGK